MCVLGTKKCFSASIFYSPLSILRAILIKNGKILSTEIIKAGGRIGSLWIILSNANIKYWISHANMILCVSAIGGDSPAGRRWAPWGCPCRCPPRPCRLTPPSPRPRSRDTTGSIANTTRVSRSHSLSRKISDSKKWSVLIKFKFTPNLNIGYFASRWRHWAAAAHAPRLPLRCPLEITTQLNQE